MKNKIFSLLVAMILLVTMLMPVTALAATSGTAGDLTWELDDAGILTISGKGEMPGYGTLDMPWYNHRKEITEVIIEDGVSNIGNCAFFGITNLIRVKIPESIISIGARAFDSCISLTEIYLPKSVSFIDTAAFFYCHSLKNITVEENSAYFYSDDNGVLFNKDKTELICYPAGSDSTTYEIPASVDYVRDLALAYCSNLSAITVNENNTSYYADSNGVLFQKDKNLLVQYPAGNKATSYDIPEGTVEIGTNAFAKTHLMSINIPDGVVQIGHWAFGDSVSLRSINIPDSVTSINKYAFWNCDNLTIYCNEGSYAYDYALENGINVAVASGKCGENLTWSYDSESETLTISGTGDMWDYNEEYYWGVYTDAPWANNSIASVVIEDGVTSIGRYAFAMDSIEYITLPDSIVYIGYNAFYGSRPLFSCSKDSYAYEYAAEYNHKIGGRCGDHAEWRLEIPNKRLIISGSGSVSGESFATFKNDIETISIKDGIFVIEAGTFENFSALEKVYLPISISSIGEGAFAGTDIKWLYCQAPAAQWSEIEIGENNDILLKASFEHPDIDWTNYEIAIENAKSNIESVGTMGDSSWDDITALSDTFVWKEELLADNLLLTQDLVDEYTGNVLRRIDSFNASLSHVHDGDNIGFFYDVYQDSARCVKFEVLTDEGDFLSLKAANKLNVVEFGEDSDTYTKWDSIEYDLLDPYEVDNLLYRLSGYYYNYNPYIARYDLKNGSDNIIETIYIAGDPSYSYYYKTDFARWYENEPMTYDAEQNILGYDLYETPVIFYQENERSEPRLIDKSQLVDGVTYIADVYGMTPTGEFTEVRDEFGHVVYVKEKYKIDTVVITGIYKNPQIALIKSITQKGDAYDLELIYDGETVTKSTTADAEFGDIDRWYKDEMLYRGYSEYSIDMAYSFYPGSVISFVDDIDGNITVVGPVYPALSYTGQEEDEIPYYITEYFESRGGLYGEVMEVNTENQTLSINTAYSRYGNGSSIDDAYGMYGDGSSVEDAYSQYGIVDLSNVYVTVVDYNNIYIGSAEDITVGAKVFVEKKIGEIGKNIVVYKNFAPDKIVANSITLDQTSLTLDVNQTSTLTATVLPENAVDKTVKWSSSDKNIVTVSDGKVRAKSVGKAFISATLSNGDKAVCAVTVKEFAKAKIIADGGKVGDIITVSVVSPAIKNVDGGEFRLVYDNTKMELIDAKKSDEIKGFRQLELNKAFAENKISFGFSGLRCGEEEQDLLLPETGETVLTAQFKLIEPGEATFSLENPIFSFWNGATNEITRDVSGETTITITEDNTITVTNVSLNKDYVTLTVGEKETLTATVTPSDATNKSVTWRSSDEAVAIVENGVVTAKSSGSAIITVTTEDGGHEASCTVTVNQPVVDENAPKVSIAKAKRIDKNTVSVDVELEKNTGFVSLGIEVGYDSRYFTLTDIQNEPTVGGTFEKSPNLTRNPVNMSWYNTTNITYNGKIATLTFTVDENTPEGIYPITVSYYKGVRGNYEDGIDVNFDENDEPLGLGYVNGFVKIPMYTPGDINGDNKITDKDAITMIRYLAGWEQEDCVMDALDTNGDGKINSRDAIQLIKYLAGWDVELN